MAQVHAIYYTFPDFIEDSKVKEFSTLVTGNDVDNTTIASATRPDARGADDVVNAGLPSSLVFAGAGNGLIKAERGDDTVFGDSGNDTLEGGSVTDLVFGSTNNGIARGGCGNDVLFGELGDDLLLGEVDNGRQFGGHRNDVLLGGTVMITFSVTQASTGFVVHPAMAQNW